MDLGTDSGDLGTRSARGVEQRRWWCGHQRHVHPVWRRVEARPIDPSRPPLPPFELPAGCGDGVITPGQYDCFFPVPIDWVTDAIGGVIQLHPLDLEGDGRDEMVSYGRCRLGPEDLGGGRHRRWDHRLGGTSVGASALW